MIDKTAGTWTMRLDPTDLATLSRLLDEALDLSPVDFEHWLAALPAEHRHLLPRLRDMLASQSGRGDIGFLSDGPRLAAVDESVAHAGDPIGPYRLIREIGHGGMGTVWLAERADGTLKRQIALKLPRLAWGAGLNERMARERDIGALLEHPNIARLYDAGVDDLGRPYLALEFVDGVPIDRWADQGSLDGRARVTLFMQVVRAVAYAHGRLVIHRDIKPSNVLVTRDGVAHLLDFGIAKLVDDAAGGDPLTRDTDRFLTPRYSSPEQISGEAITVVSDVYSLGALLYEMLTGRHPYRLAHDSAAAFEHAILRGDVVPAGLRTTAVVSAKVLRGELEAILAKALRRDPTERYRTADALADDLQRHLDGERVLAQPDSASYRLRKFVTRHRTGVAASLLIGLAVLGGTATALVFARQASAAAELASAEARRADAAAERARAVNEFVIDIFRINEQNKKGDAEALQLPVEALLDRGASLIQNDFASDPDLQSALYGVVARIFVNMGATTKAAMYAGRHVDALEAIRASRSDRARANILLASTLLFDTQPAGAEHAARRAMELSEPRSPQWVEAARWLFRILVRSDLREAIEVQKLIGDWSETRKQSWLVLDEYIHHRMPFADAESIVQRNWSQIPDRIASLQLGTLYLLWGDVSRADPLIKESTEAIRLANERSEPILYAIEIGQVAAMVAGRHPDSERYSQEVLDPQRFGHKRRRMLIGFPDVKPLNLMMQRRFDEAEKAVAEGPSERYGSTDGKRRLLARIKLERGDPVAALALLPDESSDRADQWILFDDRLLRGEVLCAAGERRRGLVLLEAGLEHQQSIVYQHHPELVRVRAATGLCALANGQREKAIGLVAAARASLVAEPGVSPWFKRPVQQLSALLESGERRP